MYKFRGKRIDNKAWVYGAYYQHEKVTLCPLGVTEEDIKDNELHLIINGGFSDWNLPAGLNCYEVIPETVGQFTRLNDKNGKEIWQGDIGWDDHQECYGVVKFDEGKFIYQWENICEDLWEAKHDIEIISTIHDNPELLESEINE